MDAKHIGTMLLIDEIADCIGRTGYLVEYVGVRSCPAAHSAWGIAPAMLIATYSVLAYGCGGKRIRIEAAFYDFCVDDYSLAGMTTPIIKGYLDQEVDKQLGMSDMKMGIYQERAL